MRDAIERVIDDILDSQYRYVRNKYEDGFNLGLRVAARKVKAVLTEHGANDGIGISRTAGEETKQIPGEENRG